MSDAPPHPKKRVKKKVRKVKPASTKPSHAPARSKDPDTYLAAWGHVVSGIVDLNAEELYGELEQGLKPVGQGVTGSELMTLLEEAQANFHDAGKLADKARLEYELYKETVWLPWLEERKTAARAALEEEKKEKDLKKQITNDMIMDQVRVTFQTDYAARFEKLKRFQAAVHSLERLVDAWKARPRSLNDMKDLVMMAGSAGSRR